jgi:ATP-dependent Lon protease
MATVMYYTPVGGDIMFVEASIRRREAPASTEDGETTTRIQAAPMSLILTGQLGDVMKESARAALTYATNNAGTLGIPAHRLDRAMEAHPRAGGRDSEGRSIGGHRDRDGGVRDVRQAGPPRGGDDGEITLRGRVLDPGIEGEECWALTAPASAHRDPERERRRPRTSEEVQKQARVPSGFDAHRC